MLFLSHLCLQAAKPVYTLYGRVTNTSNEPVSYAALSFNDGKFATTTDVDGLFQIKLERGVYTCKTSAFSYQAYEFTLDMAKDTDCNIELKEDAVQLQGVNVIGKSIGKQLEEGAFSVKAVEIAPNLNKMVTLNGLIDRTAGVKVRREG